MSDVIATLARLTPTAADRDDLLFRAGRASAPRRRGWIVLAGLLVLINVATAVLWLRDATPTESPTAHSTPAIDFDTAAPDPDSIRALRKNWNADSPLPVSSDPVESETPWRIWSARGLD